MLTSNSNSDCLFCSIIDRKEDAIILWETDHFISFMDKYPINPGHVLVLPKNHYEFLTDMNDDDVGLLFQNVSKIAKSMQNAIPYDGINIGQSNGNAASQQIFHVHVHIIPRFKGDSGKNFWPDRKNMKFEEILQIAEKIKSQLENNM